MRVLRPEASALLRLHGMPLPSEWRHLAPGEVPPSCAAEQVMVREATCHVAAARHRATTDDGQVRQRTALPPASIVPTHPELQRCALPSSDDVRSAYQAEAQRTIFERDEATGRLIVHSGVVIAPCGAGKTIIGKHAACAIGRPALVVTSSSEAATQWAAAFDHVAVRVLDRKTNEAADPMRPPAVSVTTYDYLRQQHRKPFATLAAGDRRATEALIALYVWRYGLVIFDEVHTLPAQTHLAAAAVLHTEVRLGLTADERRSDGKQDALLRFVGPVLFELTSTEARARGIIASIRYTVVKVAPSPGFLAQYEAADAETKRMLAVLCPQKVHALVATLRRRTQATKAIVFCDKLEALPLLEDVLHDEEKQPGGRRFLGVLSGDPKQKKRRRDVYEGVRSARSGVALFSKVGGTALDFPDVDLIVEVSLVEGAAQQKTQRDGRAQRVCEGKEGAEVVSLVMGETHEERFAAERDKLTRSGLPIERKVVEVAETPLCPWSEAALPGLVGKQAERASSEAAPERGGKRTKRA